MHEPRGLADLEIVEQSASSVDGLGTHTGWRRYKILRAHLRNQTLQVPDERLASDRSVDFSDAGAPMLSRKPTHTRKPHEIPYLAPLHRAPRVALTGERQYRVWPCMHVAVGSAAEVHAKKWELRLSNGVDQPANEETPRLDNLVVLATKWNDAQIWTSTERGARELIGVEPATVDNEICLEITGRGLDHDRLILLEDGVDATAEHHLTTQFLHLSREDPCDLAEVDDARVEHVERSHAGDVRFQLSHPLGPNALNRDPIRAGTFLEGLQPLDLRLSGRHDELAADLVTYSVLGAELHHRGATSGYEVRLPRIGPVVDPRVQNTGVSPGLVQGDSVFLLQHGQPQPWAPHRQRVRCRQPDDASANDYDVEASLTRHRPIVRYRVRQRGIRPRTKPTLRRGTS